MCITWLLHIYTQLTFPKRSNLTVRYLNDDGHILAIAWYIYWVVPKKHHTPPTEKISLVQRGESYEECLKFVQDVHKGGGGIVNFLHGGYGYFLEQPILWKHKKKILSRNKLPCIFNNHINCSNKNLTTNFLLN